MNDRQNLTHDLAPDKANALTVLCFRLDDDVPFNQQTLQSGAVRRVELRQRKSADPRWPETLECLRILAPRLN